MSTFRNNNTLKRLLSAFLMIVLVFTACGPVLLTTQKAEAGWNGGGNAVIVVGGPGSAAQIATAQATETYLGLWTAKEWWDGLDGLVWILINGVIEMMLQSITSWVSSGFNGSPAFVQDLEQFLLDVANVEFGGLIEELSGGFLCSPFALDVQFALTIRYQESQSSNFDKRSQCTLTGVVDNIDDFLNGDFTQGGWDGWFSLVTEQQNNPYGAFLMAEHEGVVRISNKQNQEIKLLDFGEGFFSFRDESGKITSPGAVIEDQLNKTLDIPNRRLSVADEINELIGEVFSTLLRTIFTDGLTSFGSDGENAGYWNREEDENGKGETSTSTGPIGSALARERTFLALLERVADVADEAEDIAAQADDWCTLEVPSDFEEAKKEAEAEIPKTKDSVEKLIGLNARYETSDDPTEKIEIVTEYTKLIPSLHTNYDLTTLKSDTEDLEAQLAAFKREADLCGIYAP